jgi:hypothetical protein
VALLAVAALRLALPSSLSIGPDWAMAVAVPVLLVPTFLLHRAGRHAFDRVLGYIVTGIVTADMVLSLGLLISRLPEKKESPRELLIAAAGLWFCNVLIFASW